MIKMHFSSEMRSNNLEHSNFKNKSRYLKKQVSNLALQDDLLPHKDNYKEISHSL